MTELHHFHPARKGSGSLRPFPIYPLYTQTVILSLDKPIADCFLFRPRKRLEKCRKRSHTNVSNASVTRTSTPPAQAAHVRFRTRKRVHTRLSEKNRTQRLARRNRGASLRSCAEYLVAASSLKEQPEKVDARQWRVSAFPGPATSPGCGNLFFCYSVVIFAPLPVWSTTGIFNQDY